MVILDDYFPEVIGGFRLAEYNAYFAASSTVEVLSTKGDVESHIADYERVFPECTSRVRRFSEELLDSAGLAYMNFLNNAAAFLPALTAADVPFVLTMYPGGGLALGLAETEEKLNAVLSSQLLQAVITTQPITTALVNERVAGRLPITEVLGVVANPIYFQRVPAHATYVGEGKPDLNVCFVAERYMAGGLNKGFPEFLETVLRLRKAGVSATGHVVGGCTPDDSPSPELLHGITFYGRLTTEALMDFFSTMDVIVSANRPGVLIEGNFDGFPTGCCVEAALCGVAVVAADELGQNRLFRSGHDIVIVRPDAEECSDQIIRLLERPSGLADLARRGQYAFRSKYTPTVQIGARRAVLSSVGDTLGIPDPWDRREHGYA